MSGVEELHWRERALKAEAENERLRDRVLRLEDALQPFANACEKVARFVQARAEQGGSPVMPFKDFRLAHFQAASAALSQEGK